MITKIFKLAVLVLILEPLIWCCDVAVALIGADTYRNGRRQSRQAIDDSIREILNDE
jgi:hypothetical protein